MKSLIAVAALFAPMTAFAASCDDYPRPVGIDPEALLNGRWIATAEAGVSFDDVDSINDARTEATMAAKALIASTMGDAVKRQEIARRSVEETTSAQGESKDSKLKALVQRMTEMSSSTEALLRGAIVVGDCYTKGKTYRVTVGIKPETTRAAEELARTTSGSIAAAPTPTAMPPQRGQPQRPSQGQPQGTTGVAPGLRSPLNGMDGFSNTQGLTKF